MFSKPHRNDDVFTNTNRHGTYVLSTMAGYIENSYIGTAPDASYYLFLTDSPDYNNPIEESFWVEAVERADSLGVDIINSSLTYLAYNNSNYSHISADFDGNTTFITKGANIASEKGMIIIKKYIELINM